MCVDFVVLKSLLQIELLTRMQLRKEVSSLVAYGIDADGSGALDKNEVKAALLYIDQDMPDVGEYSLGQ